MYSGGGGRPYLVEGIGEDFWPTTYDPSVVDRVIAVPDANSFATARRVTREEGLHRRGFVRDGDLGRPRGGARPRPGRRGRRAPARLRAGLPVQALQRRLDGGPRVPPGGRPDRGQRARQKSGGLPPLVHVHPDETVRAAIALLREYEVSQVPVVKAEPPLSLAEVVGSVTDRALLERAFEDPSVMEQPVSAVMDRPLPTIGTGETDRPGGGAPARTARRYWRSTAGHPVGILTRSDLLAYLARQ